MANYRTQIQVDGGTMETLQDILPQGNELNILFVGKVPTPFSVKEGHYFQGRQGKMFWNKLQKYDILHIPSGSKEDEQLLNYGYGIVDITKIPKKYGVEPSADEYRKGAEKISSIIGLYKPKVIVFIYKRVLDRLLDCAFNMNTISQYGFNRNLERVLGSKIFVFPMPGTPCKKDDADKYMMQLKKLISGD
ncbi:uracil-DNA glycosylase family protein [Clostridium sp. BJN0013]|uniref:uracil-DNA glycosylase family protein n=1 Tax=Clostridium sp. BJN0013 TaxID=3236840 RepID=UPI0034C66EB6